MVAYEEMTVVELKEILGEFGLLKTGKKADLIKRLQRKDQNALLRRDRPRQPLRKLTDVDPETKAEAIRLILNRPRK